MMQLNLLPDVKLEYLKAERLKQFMITISVIASTAALFIFILLVLTVKVWQHKTIGDLNGDIQVKSAQLQNTPDLNKILTIQSQLNSLDSLHAEKPVTERLIGFVEQVTPSTATISDFKIDYPTNTITLTGGASGLSVVNTFVDGLKFTNYTTDASTEQKKAFSNVVLSSFTRDSRHATYTITLNFDPTIFQSDTNVSLVVPNQLTTRSIIEQPNALFQKGSR